MIKEVKLLIELQEIDSQITEIDASAVYLPGMLKDLEEELSHNEAKLADAEAKRDRLLKEQVLLEQAQAATRDQLTRSQKRLYEVRSNKEYDAVQAEILSREETIGKNDEAVRNVQLELDRVKAEITELIDLVAFAKEHNADKIDDLRKRTEEVQARVSLQVDLRKKVVAQLPMRIISTYERLRGGCNGVAVVKIRQKRICSGCFKEQPLQKTQEIRHADKLFFCEACGRILWWDPETSGEE